ncbi:hypothetical protein [Desulfobaculum sp.]
MSVGDSGYESTTTINAVDPEAARKLATLSEEQLALYKEHFLPYERELANANLAVLPERQGLTTEELATQRELLPLRRRVAQAGLEETLFDLELGRPVKEALVSEQLAEMERRAPSRTPSTRRPPKGRIPLAPWAGPAQTLPQRTRARKARRAGPQDAAGPAPAPSCPPLRGTGRALLPEHALPRALARTTKRGPNWPPP